MIDYSMVDFGGIDSADGITEEEGALIRSLVDVFNDRLSNNLTRLEYYEDKNRLKNIGLNIPNGFDAKVNTAIGWCAKACDYLAARSVFDGFTAADGVEDELQRIFEENDFNAEYEKAKPSQLTFGIGFWTVSRGAPGEQRVVVNYHNAISAAALWDFRHKRVKAGFVIEDYELVRTGGKETYRPCFVVMHTDKAVVEFERNGCCWKAARKQQSMGRPLMVAMPFRPMDTKPLGKSRISPACMAITDEMQREVMRTSLHSEVFSSSHKAVLGASDEQYDALVGSKFRAAMTDMLVMTRDENGDVPQVTQFAQQSMEPHVKAIELCMSRMAAVTSIPVAAYGLSSNGYTSTDALRASSDDLVLEAETMNAQNQKALVEVARLALATSRNETVDLTKEEYMGISVHWRDPSNPSMASISDAMMKQATVIGWIAETDVFLEKLGYSEDERIRLLREKDAAKAATTMAFALTGGEPAAVTDDAD